MLRAMTFGLAVALAAPAAFAADAGTMAQDCGKPATGFKKDLVNAIDLGGVHAAFNDAGQPVAVVWQEPGEPGSVKVAARDDSGAWVVKTAAENSSVSGAFVSKSGHIAVFTMWSVEGPGPEFMLLGSRNDLQDSSCTAVRFPDTLNKPDWALEFLDLLDFNGSEAGHVSLSTAVANDEDKSVPFPYYTYQSQDGGRTWSAPEGAAESPAALLGDYKPMTKLSASDQLAELPEVLN